MSSRSFQSEKEKYAKLIPSEPVKDKQSISLLFVKVVILQDEVKIARGLQQTAPDALKRLLELQMHLATAASDAFKMAAIRELSLATEPSHLFTVDMYWRNWKISEHMISAVKAEISMRANLASTRPATYSM